MKKIIIIGCIYIALLIMFPFFIDAHHPLLIVFKGKIYFPTIFTYSYRDFFFPLDILDPFLDSSFMEYLNNNNAFIIKGNFIQKLYNTYELPSWHLILGTNNLGENIFITLLYDVKNILFMAVIISFFSIGISFILGVIQGYYMGVWDIILNKIYEILLATPFIVVVLFLRIHGMLNMLIFILSIIMFNILFITPYVRNLAMYEAHQSYIVSLIQLEVPTYKILWHMGRKLINNLSSTAIFTISNNILLLISINSIYSLSGTKNTLIQNIFYILTSKNYNIGHHILILGIVLFPIMYLFWMFHHIKK